MYMPTKHIQLIHKQLFNDGVLTAEKKLEAKHPDLNIPNSSCHQINAEYD